MSRVVHVLDPAPAWRGCVGGHGAPAADAGSPLAALVCAEAIAATPELEHTLVILGTAADAAAVGRLGLAPAAIATAPHGVPRLAWRSLRRALRSVGTPQRIQAWSDRAMEACLAAGAGAALAPFAATPSLGAAIGAERAVLRRRLGVAEGTPLVALLADPARYADARRFVYMIGLLDVAGIPVAGLIGGGTAHADRASRFHTEAAVGWKMIRSAEPVAALLHACDLAVVVPPAPHPELSRWERTWVRWSVLRSHLLGVPVVGASRWIDEELCPGETLAPLDAQGASITDIGRRLARLVGDRDEREEVSRAVRAHAEAMASREQFGRALRLHWGVRRPVRERGGLLEEPA